MGSFLSLGSRRSSTVSNYGNTPIVMRRSCSSSGGLEPTALQGTRYASLRGAPPMETTAEQFGSLRGLHVLHKRPALANLEEKEEHEWVIIGQQRIPSLSDRPRDNVEPAWNSTSDDTSVNSLSKKPENIKRAGLFRRSSNESHNKDKWRDQNSSSEVKGQIVNETKLSEIRKSSESLLSVKKKKKWFWQKSSKDYSTNLESPAEEVPFECAASASALVEKAASVVSLRSVGAADDSCSLHEELRRSQIPLKGYSQRTLAGMNLSNRLSGTNQSVTSRTSLTGSELHISDSSKSFMQYDLPRSKETSSKCSNSNIADKIREGYTYEERLNTSLDNQNDADAEDICKSPESLLEDYIKSDKRRILHKIDLSNSQLEVSSHIPRPKDRNIAADSTYGNIPTQSVQLSPDSRPIRPLQHSTSVPCDSPSPGEQIPSHSTVSGQQSYPHTLMDRPILTRLAKRISGEELLAKNGGLETEVLTKKSNIAYTLTFQVEPITVNYRTKSQSVTPEPYSTPLLYNSSPECHRTPNVQAVETSQFVDASQLPDTADCEQPQNYSHDRETSPGYRVPFTTAGTPRSPTPPKKSSRKNPRVFREKDTLGSATAYRQLEFQFPHSVEQVYSTNAANKGTPDEDVAFEVSEDKYQTHTSKNSNVFVFDSTSCTENPSFTNGKHSAILSTDLSSNELDINGRIDHDKIMNKNEDSSQNESEACQQPNSESKLQRRNTFTLPSKDKPHVVNCADESKESLVKNSHSNGDHLDDLDHFSGNENVDTVHHTGGFKEESPRSDDVPSHSNSVDRSPNNFSSRLPISRGGKARTSGSRIPTKLPSAVPSPVSTPVRSSARRAPPVGPVSGGRKQSLDSAAPTLPAPSMVVKRETILQIIPEATSTVCSLM